MKTFVFDLDGVVRQGPNFTIQLEKEHGIARARWGSFFETVFVECLLGRRDLRKELANVLPILAWNGSVDDLMDFWFKRENTVSKEVLACASRLKLARHRCYIATNQERYRAEFIAHKMDLVPPFDGIFASALLGCAKPDLRFFKAVESALATRDIIFVDDSLLNVQAAASIGWTVVLYKNVEDLAKVLLLAGLD